MTAPLRKYTPLEKLNECDRELRMRRRVYPDMLERARPERRAWVKAQLDEQIAILEQIAADYRAQVEGHPGPLFETNDRTNEHQEQPQ